MTFAGAEAAVPTMWGCAAPPLLSAESVPVARLLIVLNSVVSNAVSGFQTVPKWDSRLLLTSIDML